ncbi:MAG: peptidylprolyl isomerase [Burkholderiales bacterium]|jgi:peptidyl-prolyl cis-trans isomerase C|nr:peptidylprolyl isomerase [Burkholderiales bacterium]
MKKMLALLLLSSAALIGNSFAATVYVNGKAVDQKIIAQAMNQFKKSSPMAAAQMSNPQFQKEILQSIGMQQAILAEGNSQGLDKSDAYQQKLQEIKPMIYAQILQEKSVQGSISDADTKAKYDQLKDQAAKQKQYKVSHILVKEESKAKELIAKLDKGAKFADLAKKNSIDPGSKTKGGDLGWSDGSNYVPEFTKAVQGLEKGKYTKEPVKSQFGYHIIMLEDVKTGSANTLPPYDKVKEQLKQQIQSEKTRAFFDGLKAKYKVEVK